MIQENIAYELISEYHTREENNMKRQRSFHLIMYGIKGHCSIAEVQLTFPNVTESKR